MVTHGFDSASSTMVLAVSREANILQLYEMIARLGQGGASMIRSNEFWFMSNRFEIVTYGLLAFAVDISTIQEIQLVNQLESSIA